MPREYKLRRARGRGQQHRQGPRRRLALLLEARQGRRRRNRGKIIYSAIHPIVRYVLLRL